MTLDFRFPLQVPLDTILEFMSHNLSNSPDVLLIALLRNAHDANSRRAELADDPAIAPSELSLGVHVSADPEQMTLTVADDGRGLTAQQVRLYMDYVNEGDAAEATPRWHESHSHTDHLRRHNLARMLLQILPLSESVTMESLSEQSGSEPVRITIADGVCHLTRGNATQTGTAVTVKPRPNARHLCDPQTLPRLIKLYADYLDFPIFWQDRQINVMSPPWYQSEASTADYIGYLHSRSPELPAPLLVVPLSLQSGDAEVRGVLWVPGSPLSVLDGDLGCVDIYWRRMLAAPGMSGVLPTWARFFTGIIDSNLPPQSPFAARGFNSAAAELQAALEHALLDALRHILTQAPDRFAAIAQRHDQLLKLAALENDDVFELTADHLLFSSSSGRQTLAEYLYEVTQATGKSDIQYQTVPLEPFRDIVRAHSLLVIDASEGLDEEFLHKYDHHNPTVHLLNIEGTEPFFLEEVLDPKYQPLVALFSKLDPPVTVQPARFEPSSVPAIIAPRRPDLMRPQLEKLLLLSQIARAMRPEARSALQRALTDRADTTPSRVLHLNVNCPVVNAMLDALAAGKHEVARVVAQGTLLQAQVIAGSPVAAGFLRELNNALISRLLANPDETGTT